MYSLRVYIHNEWIETKQKFRVDIRENHSNVMRKAEVIT